MKVRLILIDDDADEASILTDILNAAAISNECTWFPSLFPALESLPGIQPDLIFVDYNMPKLNGIDCIREIRKNAQADTIPLILYSSQIDPQLYERAIRAGALSCINKASNAKSVSDAFLKIYGQLINK